MLYYELIKKNQRLILLMILAYFPNAATLG